MGLESLYAGLCTEANIHISHDKTSLGAKVKLVQAKITHIWGPNASEYLRGLIDMLCRKAVTRQESVTTRIMS